MDSINVKYKLNVVVGDLSERSFVNEPLFTFDPLNLNDGPRL